MTETETTPAEAIERLTVKDSRSRGQVLVLFALLLTFLLGTCAFVVDLAWIWVNELKVQRAADAAALAGVVHLPGAVGLANSSALDESRFNGYRDSIKQRDPAAGPGRRRLGSPRSGRPAQDARSGPGQHRHLLHAGLRLRHAPHHP